MSGWWYGFGDKSRNAASPTMKARIELESDARMRTLELRRAGLSRGGVGKILVRLISDASPA